jgi:DNA adenine methylase
MGKYNCEKCGKEFNQKSHYTTHTNKKNPCVVESKIKEMIDNAVKEKLIEIKKTSPSDIINNIEIVYDNKLVKDVPTKKIHIPKPILKWVGGKTQIIDKLITDFPVEINNYREAFLGGGSVLLTLLSYVKSGIIKIQGNIYAYDLNEPLIYIYKNIQTHHNELYNVMQTIITDFNECGNGEINRTPKNIAEAKIAKENYYYWIRSEYNKLCLNNGAFGLTDKKSILGSAMFIFLNKTCFRGVFRVGPKGFNVPYGHYNNPEIINKEHLEEIHNLIQNVVFECCDFNTSLTIVEPNDFVYLDPPYAPETDTSFVGYTENGFNIENHNNLFKLIHILTDTNKKIMLSNADVSLVRENFTNEKYNTLSILCKRSINSKNPDAKAKEVIIKNY